MRANDEGPQQRPEGFYPTWGAAVLTGCIGGVILWLVVTKKLNNYLQPYFLPWMGLTGCTLIALSIWTAIGLIRTPQTVGEDSPLQSSAGFLIVPMILLVVVQPSALGSAMLSTSVHSTGAAAAALSNTGGAGFEGAGQGGLGRNPDGTIAYPPLPKNPPEGFNDVTVEDLSQRFAFGKKEDLQGVPVSVVGFAADGEDGEQLLGRYKIYCCAADALPYVVKLEAHNPTRGASQSSGLEKDQWYEVKGTVRDEAGSRAGEEDYVVISVEHVERIEQPERPYL